MIVLNIETLVVLLIGTWTAGFLGGVLFKRRCKRNIEAS